jgi:transcriptional regulator
LYIPKANEEKRISVMHKLVRSQPLASLVTMTSTGLFASHIPLILEEDATGLGILRGHISRANAQWKDIDAHVEALAIFSGPQHYITPSWYAGKLEDGKEVPTWNYAVVHAHGPLRIVDGDAAWMLHHLHQLTDSNEAARDTPWSVDDAPADFIQTMMKGIVGLELPITRLEGKWKVSQNRTEQDKRNVIQGLAELDTAESLLMANLVAERM